MSGIVNDVVDRKERPAYVSFHRLPVEDKAKSLEMGHYVAKDVDMAHITAPYSKDIFKIKAAQWFADMARDVQLGKMPQDWADNYKKQYDAWKNGQELPLNGTPIRGWMVISPAQQETLIRMNVLTVEDAAEMNDEGLRNYGMGAADLKFKAKGWLSQAKDKGPLTMEIAAVQAENTILKGSVESLQKQVTGLMAMVQAQQTSPAPLVNTDISASDLLDDEINDPVAAYQAKFGKPPHHKMKRETIIAALKG